MKETNLSVQLSIFERYMFLYILIYLNLKGVLFDLIRVVYLVGLFLWLLLFLCFHCCGIKSHVQRRLVGTFFFFFHLNRKRRRNCKGRVKENSDWT